MITRRDYNIRCYWWSVDKTNPELNELTYNQTPSGVFFAKESQITNKSDYNDNGIVDIDQVTTTIETTDDISKIEHKDVVEFLGKRWIVENIQSRQFTRRSQYDVRPARIWWLSLRTGD